MADESYQPLEEMTYRKSNSLIASKWKSTLLENRLLSIALTRIESRPSTGNRTELVARLYPGELKRLIGDPTHIYSRLKTVSKSMTGHSMVIEDGKGNFSAMAIVTNATYQDGVLTIHLNPELRRHILGLEKRYTTLTLSVMMGFRRDASFRLYEIFKSNLYKKKPGADSVVLEYNIAELRFMIGLANADDPLIRQERIKMGSDVDWDVLYDKLDKKDKVYARWSEFERNVLRPAKEELKEKSDIAFDYEGIRKGRWMKLIRFTIYPNTPAEAVEINERKAFLEEKNAKGRQTELPRDIPKYAPIYDEFVGHNELTPEDIDHLVKVADGDIDLIRSAIDSADKQPSIRNYMGWIVSFIERKGYTETAVLHGSAEEAKMVQAVMDKAHEPDVSEKVWERLKDKAEFDAFLSFLSERGLTVEMVEEVYSANERNKMYFAWKKGRDVTF